MTIEDPSCHFIVTEDFYSSLHPPQSVCMKGMQMNFPLIRTAVALAMTVGASAAMAQDVTGAGASFPAPLYAKWADSYNKATGARINYQSVGSGAGMKQIRGKTVDFGASDAP